MRDFLRRCRQHFVYAGVFSFFANILMLALPLYMLQLFDRVLSSRSEETLLMLTLVTAGALAAMAALDVLRSRLLLGSGLVLDREFSPKVLGEMLEHAASPTTGQNRGSLRDINAVRGFLTGPGILAFYDAPWVPLFSALIFLLHPLLGVISVIGVLVLLSLAWTTDVLTRRHIERATAGTRTALRFAETGLRNAETVSALGMIDSVLQRYGRLSHPAQTAQGIAGNRAAVLNALTKFFRLLIQVAMLGTGAWLVIEDKATAGVMIASSLILARALAPVELAVASWRGFVEARAAYRRLQQFLGREETSISHLQLPPPKGNLLVDRVIFTFAGIEQPVLKGISFEIAPGTSFAIAGPSGAGKSTLARLIAGVWKPLSGVVRLDGCDVTDWDRTALGSYVGYLPQAVEFFPGTVAENIARLSAAPSEDVVAAAQEAGAHDMILRLPDGYDTEIHEGGAPLSAGQNQRIALARALFGNPRLVVLDEPNANLDSEGEEALIATIARLSNRATTLVLVSHKPSIATHTQKMLVLRDGRVDLIGPTPEVMRRVSQIDKGLAPATPLPAVEPKNKALKKP